VSYKSPDSKLRILRGLLQFLRYAVEYTVNELHRLRAGKLSSDLERFVDDHRARRIRIGQELRDSRSQQITIDRCHALHAPVFGVAFDQLVDLCAAVGGDAEEIVGKSPYFGAGAVVFGPERFRT
jgi:hypothetical protein